LILLIFFIAANEAQRQNGPYSASDAAHQFDDGAEVDGAELLRASGNLLKSWSRRAGGSLLETLPAGTAARCGQDRNDMPLP